jgi:glycosyltransferase involved in cell wall biosynthesis/GT2 family glycosyltransferase
LKYWLLTTEYPPLFGGGISTYCYHTANMLAENGYAVSIFIPDERIKNYEIEENNSVRIIRFSLNRTGMQRNLSHFPNMAYEFADILRCFIQQEGQPDCVESQEYLAISYYILQFKLLKYAEFENVPIILTLHSPAFLYLLYNREGIYSFPNYWIGEMEKSCIQSADYIVAPSHYIIDEIKKYTSFDERKVSVIRNPYRSDHNGILRKDISRNKVVFFGKLSPQKGVFELFNYMKELWDGGFGSPLLVIGGEDKVYYPEMRTMGQIIRDKYATYIQKGLIQFTGRIAPEGKAEYLLDAHLIIIPSVNDNLPYTAIEAMSMGKVILVSIQGGQKEMITDGVDGFVFDHEKPGSFAEKFGHILSLNIEELEKVGNAAIEKSSAELNYDSIYAKKNGLIQRIISETRNSEKFPFIHPAYSCNESRNTDDVEGLLSVVIPYFNMGNYIAESIQSILLSTYQNIEIILINDGSTEQRSIDLLQEFEQNQKIKIIHKKNEGLAEARNHGSRIAKGEYLAFIDADDKIHAEYYAKAINVLRQYQNVYFVGGWAKYFGEKKGVWQTWNPEPPYILLHNSVNSSALVYKKFAFMQGGLFDKKVDYGLEDYESVINMLHHGYGGVILPECLFFYRVRNKSMFRALTHYKTLFSYQYIADKHADFYAKFAPQIFNLLNANGPSFAYENPSFRIQVSSKVEYPHYSLNKIKAIIKRSPALKKTLLRIADILKLKSS